ncbi:MAG: hypothetical protein QOG23_4316 [Blastocatellia bacterium]|jgi:hypothetical protein|nr:hypothetical protein [Blastocatellia bacterium]
MARTRLAALPHNSRWAAHGTEPGAVATGSNTQLSSRRVSPIEFNARVFDPLSTWLDPRRYPERFRTQLVQATFRARPRLAAKPR